MNKEATKQLLDEVIDTFVIPLANMHLNESNTCNVVELCKKAAELMERPA